ncbi:hypothetical protein ACEQ8H_004868 [Pleosporales sp. CAS-2024a]
MTNHYPCHDAWRAPPHQNYHGPSPSHPYGRAHGQTGDSINGGRGGRVRGFGDYALAAWASSSSTPPADFHPPLHPKPKNAPAGCVAPQRPTTDTIASVQTPVTTTLSNIATPPAASFYSTASAKGTQKKKKKKKKSKSARTKPGGSVSAAKSVSATHPVHPHLVRAIHPNIQQPGTESSQIGAPVPPRIHMSKVRDYQATRPADMSHSLINEFVPREGRQDVMDQDHTTPAMTVQRLDHETLVQLQIFNIALARRLQKNLDEAKAARETQDQVFHEKRSVLLSLLQIARESERGHEKTIQRLYDCFYVNMHEACMLSMDEKQTAQIEATASLKSAADFSRMASAQRELIETYRSELNDLDNARTVSRNAYSDAVHAVLIQALEAHVGLLQDGRKDSGAVASSHLTQLNEQQLLFKRQPEAEHQSIGEVLHRGDIANTSTENIQSTKTSQDKPTAHKEEETIPSKMASAEAPTTTNHTSPTSKNEASEQYWLPDGLKVPAAKADGAQVGEQPRVKKNNITGQGHDNRHQHGNKASSVGTFENDARNQSQEASTGLSHNNGTSNSSATLASQNRHPGTQFKNRKKWSKNKNKAGISGGGGNSGNEGGQGKEKSGGGMAFATPKPRPAAGE